MAVLSLTDVMTSISVEGLGDSRHRNLLLAPVDCRCLIFFVFHAAGISLWQPPLLFVPYRLLTTRLQLIFTKTARNLLMRCCFGHPPKPWMHQARKEHVWPTPGVWYNDHLAPGVWPGPLLPSNKLFQNCRNWTIQWPVLDLKPVTLQNSGFQEEFLTHWIGKCQSKKGTFEVEVNPFWGWCWFPCCQLVTVIRPVKMPKLRENGWKLGKFESIAPNLGCHGQVKTSNCDRVSLL